jgi:hypothetical protein
MKVRAADALVAAIVAPLFDGAAGGGCRVDDDQWPALLSALEHHRCLGMAEVAAARGHLDLRPAQRETLAARVEAWLALSLRVERLAIAAHRSLSGAGVDHRFLKGVVYANALYPEPSWRHFADADLLIPAELLYDAVDVLRRDLGATRLSPERRQGWDVRFAKDVPLVVDRIELDLHRTIAPGRAGFRIPIDELFAGSATVRVGNADVPMLEPVPRAVHCALSAVLGDVSIRRAALIDLRLALTAVGSQRAATNDAPLCLAERWGISDVIGTVLAGTPPVRPTLLDRPPFRRISRPLAIVRDLPTWRDRYDYACGLPR